GYGAGIDGGGPGFFVRLLPYLEQDNAYKSFDFVTSGFDFRFCSVAQTALYNSLMVPALNCPSSDLIKFGTDNACPTSSGYAGPQRPNYVGIAGAVISPDDGTTNIGTNNGYGWPMKNGVLHASRSKNGKRFRDIVDGSSNVIVVSEQGRKMNNNTDTRS